MIGSSRVLNKMYLGTILMILVLLNSFVPFSIIIPKLIILGRSLAFAYESCTISIEPDRPRVDTSNTLDHSKMHQNNNDLTIIIDFELSFVT